MAFDPRRADYSFSRDAPMGAAYAPSSRPDDLRRGGGGAYNPASSSSSYAPRDRPYSSAAYDPARPSTGAAYAADPRRPRERELFPPTSSSAAVPPPVDRYRDPMADVVRREQEENVRLRRAASEMRVASGLTVQHATGRPVVAEFDNVVSMLLERMKRTEATGTAPHGQQLLAPQ